MLRSIKFVLYSGLIIKFLFASNLLLLIDNALKTNSGYLAAINKHQSTSTQTITAKSYLYPNLSFSVGAKQVISNNKKPTTEISKTKVYDYGITLTQPIFVLETISEIKKVNFIVLQSELEIGIKKNELILNVLELYLDIMQIKDNISLLEIEKVTLLNQKQLVASRVKIGLSRAIDLQEIEASEANLNYQILMLNNNLSLKLDTLQSTTKSAVMPNNISTSNNIANVPLLESSLADWQNSAKSYNLNLIYLKLALQIADEEINSSRYSLLPTVNGSVAYGNELGNAQNTNYGKTNLSMGVNLSMNLFAGGRSYARDKKAKLDKTTVEYNLLEATDNTYNLVSFYYQSLLNLEEQVKALNFALQSANSNYLSAQKSYSVGLKTNNDVLVAMQNYYSAQNNLVVLKYNTLKSIANLYALIGEISEENLRLIDSYLITQDNVKY